MPITQRPYRPGDQAAMCALVHRDPAGDIHLIDLPYRLSSWALDNPDNTAVWVGDDMQLAAWAVMNLPLWSIDYAFDSTLEAGLHRAILNWADGRARQMLGAPDAHPCWFVNVLCGQAGRRADLEAAGFASQADVPEDPWAKVWMSRPATAPIPDCPAPDKLTIRPLAGMAEVDAYVALQREVFESENMTREWRQRTLRWPQYAPELDLVAVDPGGKLAAFCILWFDPAGFDGRPCGQVEPMGVRAGYQGQGLGKAILSEGLRRLRAMGAETMYVETDEFRGPALALYESAGFCVQERILVYRKDYEP